MLNSLLLYEFFLIVALLTDLILFLRFRKKTAALEERNKRLSALRKLDEVMMSSSLGLKEVTQKVTDAIAFELGFGVGVLALIDENQGVLRRVAMSRTATGIKAREALPFPYEKLEIPLSFTDNLAIKVIRHNRSMITHNLYEVFVPALDLGTSQRIQETVNVKTSLVYPVRARGKVIGVMIISIAKSEKQLSQYEFESIEALVDVIGIALDNAILYQNLAETSSKLTHANTRLRELDKLKDDFVSVASHELRTPMTAIKSYAWMALHRAGIPLTANLEKYITRIFLSTERLINLVNDMLNVSRIESGSIEINPEPVDLTALIKDIIDEVYYSKSPGKQFKFIISNRAAPKVFADPDKLRQVFLNLVGNSLKFTPPGGQIAFDFFTDGQMVDVSVSDTGVGISKEDLSKLFHKFGRLDNSYTAAATSGGTGLGLYISKSLVELMHGRIWSESEGLNKGAKFTIALPVATENLVQNAAKYRIKPEGTAKELEPAAV